jgi:hypothetical protein
LQSLRHTILETMPFITEEQDQANQLPTPHLSRMGSLPHATPIDNLPTSLSSGASSYPIDYTFRAQQFQPHSTPIPSSVARSSSPPLSDLHGNSDHDDRFLDESERFLHERGVKLKTMEDYYPVKTFQATPLEAEKPKVRTLGMGRAPMPKKSKEQREKEKRERKEREFQDEIRNGPNRQLYIHHLDAYYERE